MREAREARGMTAAELAHLVGRDRTTIYRLENGTVNPPVEQWLRIANALGISASELFDPDDVAARANYDGSQDVPVPEWLNAQAASP